MKRRSLLLTAAAVIGLLIVLAVFWSRIGLRPKAVQVAAPMESLRLAIAPYQDMAMLAAAKPQSIDKKHGLKLELISMPWDELTPAVSSANSSVDVAFASLIQFISQEPKLNANSSDPIVFFYPAYVFKGGAFVTFDPKVPAITKDNLTDKATLQKFLSHSFAVQKTSSYEILLFTLAERAGIPFKDVSRVEMDSGDGLLAAINGAVDVSAAGLTQKNEALKRKGRIVLEMDALGQVDIAGFIAKQSTITKRRRDLENMVRTWVDSIDYVLTNIDTNSRHSLAYLRAQSSTNYSIDEYKVALSQEWLPRRVSEMPSKVILPSAEYSYSRIVKSVTAYYLSRGELARPPGHIEFIDVQ